MKSSMKHWKQLVLVGMLAWALLFLMLLSYFMDSRTGETRSSAPLSHAETRRLASVQGINRAIMGSPPDPTAAAAAPGRGYESREGAPYASPDPDPDPDPDPQALAAFGTPGGADPRDPRVTPARDSPVGNSAAEEEEEEEEAEAEEGGEEEEEDEEEEEVDGGTMKTTQKTKAHWESIDDQEEYSFSKSKSAILGLWHGEVSATMLSPRLQKAMKEYLNANKHRVAYRGRRHTGRPGQEVLCELKKRAQVRALDGKEQPFFQMGWDRLVPPRPLDQVHGFQTCAVVTSAGAILNSSLGKEIDSHEAVLRFNAAPTGGYENDVGNKTTIRIINSQILANPKHRFNTSSLYKGVILVAWDPAPYTSDLLKWYNSPDYNLFTPYAQHRQRHPSQPFYILHPKFIWQLWDIIQGNTEENIQPNPPSSGFIGILLMMTLCKEVHVYEYIPSLRQTDLCHYHEQYYDAACTLGAYHPLLYEKMLIQRMNTGSEQDLKRKGKVTLPGFSAVTCDP